MTPGGSAGRLVMTFSSSSGGRGSSPVGPGGQDCDEAGCGHAPMRSGPGPAGGSSSILTVAAGRVPGQEVAVAVHDVLRAEPLHRLDDVDVVAHHQVDVRRRQQLLASPDIDLVVGNHVHVVQPVERLGPKYVVYGDGNFLARHAPCCDCEYG